MIKKVINFFSKLFMLIKGQEAICINNESSVDMNQKIQNEIVEEIDVKEPENKERIAEVRSCDPGVILTNGVAISESLINDGELNAIDRNYLMIIIYNFNLIEGYAEVSINDFLKYTNTTNRPNVIKVIERLENKKVIEKIKGGAKDSNRFLVLKHMLLIAERRVKYDTSNINVTSDEGIDEEIEYKDIIFNEANQDRNLNSKYATMLLRDTCSKNTRELNRISENYKELENRAEEFFDKANRL